MFEFTLTILYYSKNPLYPLLLNTFKEASMQLWMRCLDLFGCRKSLASMGRTADAIKAGNAKEAIENIRTMFDLYMQLDSFQPLSCQHTLQFSEN